MYSTQIVTLPVHHGEMHVGESPLMVSVQSPIAPLSGAPISFRNQSALTFWVVPENLLVHWARVCWIELLRGPTSTRCPYVRSRGLPAQGSQQGWRVNFGKCLGQNLQVGAFVFQCEQHMLHWILGIRCDMPRNRQEGVGWFDPRNRLDQRRALGRKRSGEATGTGTRSQRGSFFLPPYKIFLILDVFDHFFLNIEGEILPLEASRPVCH